MKTGHYWVGTSVLRLRSASEVGVHQKNVGCATVGALRAYIEVDYKRQLNIIRIGFLTFWLLKRLKLSFTWVDFF
jgi:hypothetical protein